MDEYPIEEKPKASTSKPDQEKIKWRLKLDPVSKSNCKSGKPDPKKVKEEIQGEVQGEVQEEVQGEDPRKKSITGKETPAPAFKINSNYLLWAIIIIITATLSMTSSYVYNYFMNQ